MAQTAESIKALIARCSYPGFEFEFGEIGDARGYGGPAGVPRIRVHCPDGICNVTGVSMPWNGRWWELSYRMVDTEVVQTAFAAVKRALEHEALEKFRFDDAAIYDRHIDVHHLVALRQQTDSLDERKP